MELNQFLNTLSLTHKLNKNETYFTSTGLALPFYTKKEARHYTLQPALQVQMKHAFPDIICTFKIEDLIRKDGTLNDQWYVLIRAAPDRPVACSIKTIDSTNRTTWHKNNVPWWAEEHDEFMSKAQDHLIEHLKQLPENRLLAATGVLCIKGN